MTHRQIDSVEHAQLLRVAHRAADAAAVITLAAFRRPLRIDDKSARGAPFDPVTDADRAAEKAIRDVLTNGAPQIGFVGEESSFADVRDADADLPCWVVDPIDGTRAFIAGIPLWGTLIALRVGDEVPIGLLDQPALQERFVGSAAGALSIRAQTTTRLRTRSGTALDNALLCCTTPDMFVTAGDRESFSRLAAAVRTVRYGTDCHGYAMLAAGHVDLVVESDLSPWDVLALVPIVRAAGGVITDWHGGHPGKGGAIIAAADGALHAAAMRMLHTGSST